MGWISAEGDIPPAVFVRFPSAMTISSFSFRSDDDFDKSPTKFDFIGSPELDCGTWSYEVILQVADATWYTSNQEQSWDIPVGKGGPFQCFGFRIHNTVGKDNAIIKDAKLWRGQ